VQPGFNVLAGTAPPHPTAVVAALGVAQILGWGTSFYFPAVFSQPIVAETGWPLGAVVGGVSIGMLAAGLISPQVGRLVERRGGRPVLLTSSLCYAAGLAGIGLSPSLPVYIVAWTVLGVGMGTGLYDTVFAALGRLYGRKARGAITNLTLFGGFASTVCWPLSAFLIDAVGWRGACLVYAALHLGLALPLQMFAMRGDPAASAAGVARPAAAGGLIGREVGVFVLLTLILATASMVGSIVVIHLLIFLQASGAAAATAIWIGALFGPAQVAARIVERILGGGYHPVWTLTTSVVLTAAGLVLLWSGLSPLVLAIVVFGGGFGISLVARGTVPLALFGPERFPRLIGRIALPCLIAQALAPSLGALLIETRGADTTIGLLTMIAILNVVLMAGLLAMRSERGRDPGTPE